MLYYLIEEKNLINLINNKMLDDKEIKLIYESCGLVQFDDGQYIGTNKQWQEAEDMIEAEKTDLKIDEFELNQ